MSAGTGGPIRSVLLCVVLAFDADQGSPAFVEGPLANTARVATEPAVEEELLRGDAALARARSLAETGNLSASQRELAQTFEAWHAAIEGADLSLWAALPDQTSGEPRAFEGLALALERRIDGLSATERRAWRARFESLALGALQTQEETELVARHPGTETAFRAALRACDLALERGAVSAATTWSSRAERALARLEPSAEARSALALRIGELAAWTRDSAPLTEAWRSAQSLVPDGTLVFPRAAGRRIARPDPALGAGVRNGIVFLDDRRAVVQTPSELLFLDMRRAGLPELAWRIELAASLPSDLAVRESSPLEDRGPPGWPLLPASDGRRVFVVAGRSPRDPESEGECGNALLAFEAPEDAPSSLGLPRDLASGGRPRLVWAIAGATRLAADGSRREESALADLKHAEFQPGPCCASGVLFVQARTYAGEVRAHLLAFSAEDGRLLWRRFIAQGADVFEDRGKLGQGDAPRLSGAPLTQSGGRLFVSTNLGVVAAIDAIDGLPIWSLRTRRRTSAIDGWDGGPARSVESSQGASIVVAPFDSDVLYRIRAVWTAEPMDGRASVFSAPPLHLGESAFLVDADAAQAVVLTGAEAGTTLMSLGSDGARVLALPLGPREHFTGAGLVSEARVLAASDRGLFLFDRSRELYLLDVRPLVSESGRANGGDVVARAERVFVLGRDSLACFRAR